MLVMGFWIFFVIFLLAFLGFICFIASFRSWWQGAQYTNNHRIDGKVVLITGANSGIGKETAIDLARRGGKIYIACRDVKRGNDALNEIIEKSGNNNVHFLQLDLASLDSIRQFSRKFHEIEDRLHVLINNAGVMSCFRTTTQDGFESQIGINHMGHFLLTNLLADILKASAPSRVVVVASKIHWYGRINKNDLNSEKSFRFSGWAAYNQSKLANVLFAREMAKKLQGTGVDVNSVHPGSIRTNILVDSDWMTKIIFEPLRHIFFKTPVSGAQTSIYAAVDPELEGMTGKYFSECAEGLISPSARNDELAKWLWDTSVQWTELREDEMRYLVRKN